MKNQSSETLENLKLENLKIELHKIIDNMNEYQATLVLSFLKELFNL